MALADDMLSYRVRENISQEEAAKRAGVTRQTWHYIEVNIQKPSRLTTAKINDLLAKSPEEKNK